MRTHLPRPWNTKLRPRGALGRSPGATASPADYGRDGSERRLLAGGTGRDPAAIVGYPATTFWATLPRSRSTTRPSAHPSFRPPIEVLALDGPRASSALRS